MRSEAMRYGRLSRGKYRCADCGKTFGRKDIAVDHIEAVINPLKGFQSWDEYIKRLFCPSVGLQILCNTGGNSCHKKKSALENKVRREAKKNG